MACPLLEDGPPDLERRRLQGHHESALKALRETRLQIRQLVGAAIGGHHQLPSGLPERIEHVEELLAGPLLARQELDVVDQDDVRLAKTILECRGAPLADRFDELAGELLDRRTADPHASSETRHVVADRVEEMRLP